MLQGRVFICDDEEGMLRYLRKMLVAEGLEVETFVRGGELLARLAVEEGGVEPDLLLQDIRMPDMDGIEVLRRVRDLRPQLPVTVMTAYGAIETAVEAIKLGAYDYVTKPFPREKLLAVVGKVLERERLMAENLILKEELGRRGEAGEIVFVSARFREVYDLTLQVARSDANILIQGESGTGKELIARAVHHNSLRKNRRFLSINCAALTDTLLESQLFGHVRGAFTGAVTNRKGFLEEADGGTLFLDEVGDMSLPIQAKLLRVIQERDFIPVGSTRAKSVDIRFVAATNKDLVREVREGRFREDLFYRLNVISITSPPLRERQEDIEPLARHFLRRFSQRIGKEVTGIAPDALRALTAYHWPGNVRELENVLERAVILTRGVTVTVDTLPVWHTPVEPVPATAGGLVSLECVEREHIKHVLARTGHHKSRTAEVLGISRKTLDRKIAEYGLVDPPAGER